ncbi:MAG: XdhC family protein [Clostridiales Family XIII bacterium]|jgi:xanthine dehydrogenase accessory factor|nr:XdhC family protein [Clostridiales Family XIII bacterium]
MSTNIYKDALENLETHTNVAIHSIYKDTDAQMSQSGGDREITRSLLLSGSEAFEELISRAEDEGWDFEGGIYQRLYCGRVAGNIDKDGYSRRDDNTNGDGDEAHEGNLDKNACNHQDDNTNGDGDEAHEGNLDKNGYSRRDDYTNGDGDEAHEGNLDKNAYNHQDDNTNDVDDEAIAENSRLETIEIYSKTPRLIILGGGHIALPLVKIANEVGFKTVVYDDRPAFANNARFPEAHEVIMDDFTRMMDRLKITEHDYICIITRGHKHDSECLRSILDGVLPHYIGMIGSKRRVAIVMQSLIDDGYDANVVKSIHSPIGLRIGAVTPSEIAISILAEIIEIRRNPKNRNENEAVMNRYKDETINIIHADGTADTAVIPAGHRRAIVGMEDETLHFLADHADEVDAILTILSTDGSVPRDAGAKMAMTYTGKTFGSIGGGCSESAAMAKAREIIRNGGYEMITVDMSDTAEDDGMVCGGTMQVMIEKL